jgi:polar amino acid transport system substrate-binding protein
MKRFRGTVVLVGLLSVVAAGCGDDDSAESTAGSESAASAKAPAAIADAGRIVYCSDMTYPPLEFMEGPTPKGADIDFGKEIAARLGVEAEFAQTGFDGIIAALQAKKCDAILSAMTNNEERRREIAFVDYAKVGQSLMVAKGNPLNTATPADLSGKSVSVLVGSLNKTLLDDVNEDLAAEGKAQIDIVTFPKDTDAVNALRTGRVDAYLSDAPVVAYYVKNSAGELEVAGEQLAVAPYGVGIRKDDVELQKAVQGVVDDLYADGTMAEILDRWGLGHVALDQ